MILLNLVIAKFSNRDPRFHIYIVVPNGCYRTHVPSMLPEMHKSVHFWLQSRLLFPRVQVLQPCLGMASYMAPCIAMSSAAVIKYCGSVTAPAASLQKHSNTQQIRDFKTSFCNLIYFHNRSVYFQLAVYLPVIKLDSINIKISHIFIFLKFLIIIVNQL